ncbi:hypothetical protein SDC9_44213 [bioreactor metagenome]|uniref:Uncharacterized protein n=1 Tax=bioreactor metagenome TaxID=1076179 RepID=A0A644W2S2_9ZZZZ
MTIHRFTPPGRFSDAQIDVLLAKYEPDEWLPVALKVPFLVGVFASGLMALALALLIFAPRFTQAALTLVALWPCALTFAIFSMGSLAHRRQAEARRRPNSQS